jgi:SAM-dependent methyltransferase
VSVVRSNAGRLASVAALPACCVCGVEAWRALPPTRLYRCRKCGTVFNDRARDREEEERLYASYSEAPPAGDERVAAAQWGWIQTITPRENGSVLDIGCGYGAFLRQAKDAGWRAAGVELDPNGARACAEHGLEVRQGSLFDVDLPEGPWDLITLWDVLEHLEHPRQALQLLVEKVAAGGLVVVRGRNAGLHASMKVFYERLRPVLSRLGPDVSCVHRWGFAADGYRRLLRRAGLSEIRTFPGLPTPGDRFSTFKRAGLASALKGMVRASAGAVYAASGGRVYPFTSVLVVGGKGAS